MNCKAILTTLLLAIGIAAGAQVTTEEEYTYLKKGIQTTFDQGLDIKKGYYLEDITTNADYGKARITAKKLMRAADSTIAGTWVKVVVSGTFSGDGSYIYAIPGPNFEKATGAGWDQLYSDIALPARESAKHALLQFMLYRYSVENNRANKAEKVINKKTRAN